MCRELTASLDIFWFFVPAKTHFVFPQDLCKLVTNLDTGSNGKSQVTGVELLPAGPWHLGLYSLFKNTTQQRQKMCCNAR